MRVTILALVSFAVAAAGSAAAQEPTPTPVEQHVVAPSLPDQPNKEGVVRPSGSVPTDEYGNIMAAPGVVDPTAAKPTPGAAAPSKGAPGAPAPGPAQARRPDSASGADRPGDREGGLPVRAGNGEGVREGRLDHGRRDKAGTSAP